MTAAALRLDRRARASLAGIRRQGLFGLAAAISVALIVLFIVYPVWQIVARSLSEDGRIQWDRLWHASQTVTTFRNTMVLGLVVGALGTFVGLVMAFVQVRTRLPGRRLLHGLVLIPIVSPPFAVAMSVLTLFGRSGLITHKWLGIRYDISGLDGLVLAMVPAFTPIAYLNFVGMLRAFDPSIEEAATDLGSNWWHRLRRVILPLLAPGIGSTFLLIFVSTIADLGTPVLLGGSFDTLSTRIYLAVIGEYSLDKAAVYSVMLLGPSLLIFALQFVWLRRKEYVTVTGKAASSLRPVRGWPANAALGAAAAVVMAYVTLLYGYIIVGAFTKVWNINFTLTLDNIRFVLRGSGFEALKDTVTLALMATPIAGFAGLVIAFVITQRRFRGRGLLDFASVLGVAVPGTIIGIGLLLAYNEPRLWGLIPELQGTATIIVLAFTIRSMPGVVRVAVGALNQLGSGLEEASVSLGATTGQTFRKIILPLIRPAMFSSLIWSFARSMTSLSPIIFLLTPQWRIMTAQILNEADQGRYSNAAAYSLVLVTVVLAAILLLNLVTGFSSQTEPGRWRRLAGRTAAGAEPALEPSPASKGDS